MKQYAMDVYFDEIGRANLYVIGCIYIQVKNTGYEVMSPNIYEKHYLFEDWETALMTAYRLNKSY